MENLAAIGAALASMLPDDGRRYADCLMLSALPGAPMVPPLRRRLSRALKGPVTDGQAGTSSAIR